MNAKQLLVKRVDDLIALANTTISQHGKDNFHDLSSRVRSQGLSFIISLNGTGHPNYSEFERATRSNYLSAVTEAKSILEGIKDEVDNDYYVTSLRGLVSAEIFSDYLDMSQYLLDENWYIPAAVLIGSTLEEHLRNLCTKNSIPLTTTDTKLKVHIKMGSELNADLYKANIYNKVDWSLVEAYQKIRNDAAHGNHAAFNISQVVGMLQGVREFIGRNAI